MKKILLLLSIFSIYSCSNNNEELTNEIKKEKNVINSVENSTISNSNTSNINEGEFIHIDSTGEIVWIFQNKLRHIVSIETWNGLFNSSKSIKAYYPNWGTAISITGRFAGNPLQKENGLIKSLEDGRIYFLDGGENNLHYINDVPAFNRYQFRSQSVRNVQYIRPIWTNFPSVQPDYYTTPDGTYQNGGTLY